jgi:hypothetical protein
LLLLHIITFYRCGDSSRTCSNMHLRSSIVNNQLPIWCGSGPKPAASTIRNKGVARGEKAKKKVSFYFRVQYTASCSVYRSVKWTPDDLVV